VCVCVRVWPSDFPVATIKNRCASQFSDAIEKGHFVKLPSSSFVALCHAFRRYVLLLSATRTATICTYAQVCRCDTHSTWTKFGIFLYKIILFNLFHVQCVMRRLSYIFFYQKFLFMKKKRCLHNKVVIISRILLVL